MHGPATTPPASRPARSRPLPPPVPAAGAGLLVGAATSGAQTLLGGTALAGLANAVSPWLLAPFLVGSRARSPRSAALAGVAACTAQVLGYYLVAALRGFAVNPPVVGVWLVAGVAGGVVFGLAGRGWRSARGWGRGLGAALLVAVWLCEALRYALVLRYPEDAVVFAVVAAALWLLLGRRGAQHRRTLAWLLPCALAGAAGQLVLDAVL
ncbi:DUF6518 family protein [Kineococcus sp. SYSU DK006]|uniref:DUF6518 family protein n=1 Tax=Kineococcus sp. SYSU DK006 TaxID=3383127 RepID=UPI003D7E3B08